MKLAESARSPLPGDPRAPGKSHEEHRAAPEQTRLQSDALQNTPQRYGAAIEPRCIAENFCKCSDRKDLRSQERKNNSKNHGVNVEPHMRSNLPRSRQQPKYQEKSGQHERGTGQQKKPVRRVEQHEPQTAPAVTKTAKMWRAPALVRPQNNGNLRDARPDLRGLDDHLQREFHPRAAQIQLVVKTAGESSHSTVTVPDARTK